jgi:hypothetical protein
MENSANTKSRVIENSVNTKSWDTQNLANTESRVIENLANTKSRVTQNSANTESRVTKKSANTENRVMQDLGGKKLEEGKDVFQSKRSAPWWCPRGITKTQKHRLQKCVKESWPRKKKKSGTIGLIVYGP